MLNRENAEYVRILELISIVAEEVGETIQSSNNFLFKGDLSELDNAIKECQQIWSPLLELQAVLENLQLKFKEENNNE